MVLIFHNSSGFMNDTYFVEQSVEKSARRHILCVQASSMPTTPTSHYCNFSRVGALQWRQYLWLHCPISEAVIFCYRLYFWKSSILWSAFFGQKVYFTYLRLLVDRINTKTFCNRKRFENQHAAQRWWQICSYCGHIQAWSSCLCDQIRQDSQEQLWIMRTVVPSFSTNMVCVMLGKVYRELYQSTE